MVSCTVFVLSHRTGGPPGREGHQLAVVAYRDGQLYCMCAEPWDGRSRGEEADEAEEEEKEGDRGKSYNLHTDGGEKSKKLTL